MAKANPIPTDPRFKDLTGKQFGDWTVLHFDGRDEHRNRFWKCRCKCGLTGRVAGRHLASDVSTNCGCARLASQITHGMSKTSEMRTWEHMLRRCYSPNEIGYENYGGRGIIVCTRWHNFSAFIADMGRKPSPKHSIERKNTNGKYEPWNCVWATAKEQARNTRRTRLLTYNGKTMCIVDWAAELGISKKTLNERLRKYGWTVEEALSTPVVARTHANRHKAARLAKRQKN